MKKVTQVWMGSGASVIHALAMEVARLLKEAAGALDVQDPSGAAEALVFATVEYGAVSYLVGSNAGVLEAAGRVRSAKHVTPMLKMLDGAFEAGLERALVPGAAQKGIAAASEVLEGLLMLHSTLEQGGSVRPSRKGPKGAAFVLVPPEQPEATQAPATA